MKYYLKGTKQQVIDDLRNAGFEWYDYDEEGNSTAREPKKGEVATLRGIGSCIYLDRLVEIPAEYDEEGNIITEAVLTTTYHANAKMRNEHTFATDMGVPSTPQHDWA